MLNVQAIYDLAVKLGINSDPRGRAFVTAELKRYKKEYDALPNKEKEYYDKEYFTNPYSDTRILYTPSLTRPIKRLFAGIDAHEPELLLADRLGKIDMVISHHPEGIALADLPEVMNVQVEIMRQAGVPVNIAENLLMPRIAEVNRGVLPINDHKAVDIARLLGMPYMAAHTATDNLAATFMDNLMDQKKHKLVYVGDVIDQLMTVPEYQIAKKQKSGPCIYLGSPARRCGRIAATEFTGGTNGAKDMFEALSRAGVGTVIGMHMREDHRKVAEQHHMNVVIAGHISSDSIGMNLFLDELEQKGIEVIPVGGLIRVKRFKSKTK
ncbi:MAG: NGG1p interacting factor NIF3 [Patescibacteria group bacterium]|jgi:putative NIF3 family GTP cyclohydrolase 1 type 2